MVGKHYKSFDAKEGTLAQNLPNNRYWKKVPQMIYIVIKFVAMHVDYSYLFSITIRDYDLHRSYSMCLKHQYRMRTINSPRTFRPKMTPRHMANVLEESSTTAAQCTHK